MKKKMKLMLLVVAMAVIVGLFFVPTSANAGLITSYARNGSEVGSDINGAFLDDDDVAGLTGAAPTIGGVATNVTAVTIDSNQERTITYTVTGSGLDFSYDVIVTAWQSVSGVESMVNIRENGGEVMPDSSLPGEHRQRIDSPDTVGAGNWEFVRLTIDNLVINSGKPVSLLGFNTVRIDGIDEAGSDGNVENAATDAVIGSWTGGVIDPTTGEAIKTSDVDLTSAYAGSIDLVATSSATDNNQENQPRGFAADFAAGVEIISPKNGDTVDISDSLPLIWTNMDPVDGNDVYVDVWFGTEPNDLHPVPDFDLVVEKGLNTESWIVDVSVPDTYYWQVNSWVNGAAHINDANMIIGSVLSFDASDDRAPTVEIHTPAMMTWSDNPLTLEATVTDSGLSELTYGWTAEPDGIGDPNLTVGFDAGAEDPEVAVTNLTGSMVTVTMILTAFDAANPEIAEASVEIDVYPDACEMAKNGLGTPVAATDFNADCITDLLELVEMISAWLDDYAATEVVDR